MARLDPHDVHRVVHEYLAGNGWQRMEADSRYHRPDPEHGARAATLGAALEDQLLADGIDHLLNPQVTVYPPVDVDDVIKRDPPAHQPGPTATYPEGPPDVAGQRTISVHVVISADDTPDEIERKVEEAFTLARGVHDA